VPAIIVVFQDSSRNTTASKTENTGEVPIRIEVRDGPIAPIEETNKP
jgi:hypothetical protein